MLPFDVVPLLGLSKDPEEAFSHYPHKRSPKRRRSSAHSALPQRCLTTKTPNDDNYLQMIGKKKIKRFRNIDV
jgi:hypothetical protein